MNTKNIIILLAFLMLVISSCEEKISISPLSEQMNGWYMNCEAISNVPLDLNYDGVKNNNLYIEIPNGHGTYRETYASVWTAKKLTGGGGKGKVYLLEPFLKIINGEPRYYVTSQRRYILDLYADSFDVVSSNEDEFVGQKIGHLLDMTWKNDTLYCIFRKEFLDIDGWCETIVRCKYVKVSDSPSFGQEF